MALSTGVKYETHFESVLGKANAPAISIEFCMMILQLPTMVVRRIGKVGSNGLRFLPVLFN
jgi:hypothetical protein